jgi:hypothetical protein
MAIDAGHARIETKLFGGYGILNKEGYNRLYLLGILNSRLTGWFISQTATQMRGGWHSYEVRFIKHIPIHPIEVSNTDGQACHDRIVELVNQIIVVKKADPNFDTHSLEAEIDRFVYQIYCLTEEEIAVVEG